jgi:hypothetical protein
MIRAVSADGNSDVLLVNDPRLAPSAGLPSYTWSGDGNLLFDTYDDGPSQLMSIEVDTKTGHVIGGPTKISDYPDATSVDNASRDGRRLLFSRFQHVVTQYVAAVVDAQLAEHPTDHQDWKLVGTSTRGDVTVYSSTPTRGQADVIAVASNNRASTIASIEGTMIDPQITPDGLNVMFLLVGPTAKSISISRVPIAGGPVQSVESLPYAPSTPVGYTEDLVAQLACPTDSTKDCVLGATEGHDQAFYEVDPEKGRTRRIGAVHGAAPWSWDLSPDGQQILISHRADDMQVIDLSGRAIATVKNPGLLIYEARWLGNTRTFITIAGETTTVHLTRFDLKGRSKSLWSTSLGGVQGLQVSPDGTNVYFVISAWSRAFWLRERSS